VKEPQLALQAINLAPQIAEQAERFMVYAVKPAEVLEAPHFVELVIVENGLDFGARKIGTEEAALAIKPQAPRMQADDAGGFV